MHLLFSCLPLTGHLNPMTALGRTLHARGHRVTFLSILDAEPAIRAAGLDFLPLAQTEFPLGEVARTQRELAKLSGLAAVRYTLQEINRTTQMNCEYGPDPLRELHPDACILDEASPGMPLVARHLGLPYVHVAAALHFDWSTHTPMPLFHWTHGSSPWHRLRNLAGVALFRHLLQPVIRTMKQEAARLNVTVDWSDESSVLSNLAHISQTPPEFDFPHPARPAHFHQTGPFSDHSARIPSSFPWEKLTGEPLLYASMGTLQNGMEHVFQTIAAAAEAPGRQLVLALGGNLDPARLGPLAPNTIAVKFAPQLELLQRARLCITHAGLNTALECLAHGVPMVALPVTNDQPGVAARILYTKTGVALPFHKLATGKLRSLIGEVWNNPGYAENARRIQQSLSQRNHLQDAAEIVERALNASRAVSPSQ